MACQAAGTPGPRLDRFALVVNTASQGEPDLVVVWGDRNALHVAAPADSRAARTTDAPGP